MAKRKKHIVTKENIGEWINSLGFLLPSNEIELLHFNKFYSDYDHKLNGHEINPEKIFDEDIINYRKINTKIEDSKSDDFTQDWKIAARNQQNISNNILLKMKKNQEDKLSDD